MALNRLTSRLMSDVTEDEVDELEDLLSAMELGELFEPEVSLDGDSITNIEGAKRRLRLAIKKANGEMKDYNAMRNAMAWMRRQDQHNRRKLTDLIVKLQGQLDTIDDTLKEQFKFEEATRSADTECKRYIEFLKIERCPVVVAGEVSSGKSTLLNMMLSEEILPAKRLSCTFTACELVYDTNRKAYILYNDGRPPVEIPFEVKDEYIYKKESREKEFDHTSVRLMLPVDILQSGITLVDTPGVGENSTTGNIILDYVKGNDVFGFIFTINAFDSGGVRSKFKGLLKDLSEILDDDKRRKLDPTSIIFVVNCWDKVPEDERKQTRNQIIYYLQKMPFLGEFDPEKQIFFMDSRGAIESLMLEAGLITDDFSDLIDGIQEFFPRGLKRKLQKAYLWTQNVIERMIHPVKAFLVGHRPRGNLVNIRGRLQKLDKESIKSLPQQLTQYKSASEKLTKTLLESLDCPKQIAAVVRWETKDVPVQDRDETWFLFEERLDKAIDDRISQVVLDVESEEYFIANAYGDLVCEVGKNVNKISNNLMDIERSLRSSVSRDMENNSHMQDLVHKPDGSNIDVNFGQQQGAELIVPKFETQSMFERLLYGPTLALFGPNYEQRKIAVTQQMNKFKKHPSNYMSNRAHVIYKHFCSEKVVAGIVQQQLGTIEEYIKKQGTRIREQIKSNTALLDNITKMSSATHTTDAKYHKYLDEMQELSDALLLLGRESIITDSYKTDDIVFEEFRSSWKTEPKADDNMPIQFIAAKLKQKHRKRYNVAGKDNPGKSKHNQVDDDSITIMKFSIGQKCGIFYRETDRHYHMENLSRRVAGEKTPMLLGTYSAGQSLILQGRFTTARVKARNKFDKIGSTWNACTGTYITLLNDLAGALNEIHLRKMAHAFLSLDTLLLDVTKNDCVRLTCLYELATIQINEEERLETGQLLYFAPEILFGNRELYTTAADVYALGLLMIELWYRHDVFHNLKKLTVKEFKHDFKGDTGKLLLEKADKDMNTSKSLDDAIIMIKMPPDYRRLVCDCVKTNSRDRIDMTMWRNRWDDIQNEVESGMRYKKETTV